MDVVVTGIGLRSCLGNRDQTWQSLLAGATGIKQHQPFSELPPLPLGLLESTPAQLSTLTQEIAADALADAQLAPPLPGCGVAIGSSRGCQAEWERAAQRIEGSDWLNTLPHQGAIATARLAGATGPVLAPMAACATGIWAIAQGRELIRARRCERVIAGAVEAPVTRLTLAGFKQIGALASSGSYPFDQQREGLVLGEGGAVFILESASSASRRRASIYGRIGGAGFSCDAHHISAPEPDSRSAAIAVKHCLAHQPAPAHIDYIHAHGTGTQLNDRREAQLIHSLFPPATPVSSTKGATGHTLGASGALGIAFSLMTLKEQLLPPCVGLRQPAFRLNFVRRAQRAQVARVLNLSFGFGGQNAAIILEK